MFLDRKGKRVREEEKKTGSLKFERIDALARLLIITTTGDLSVFLVAGSKIIRFYYAHSTYNIYIRTVYIIYILRLHMARLKKMKSRRRIIMI